jgi:four helix bundle protein
MGYRNLAVLEAAQRAADAVNALIDRKRRRRLLSVAQMRDSVQAISANISEAFGRNPGPDRNHRLVIARGETEETIQHLGTNFRTGRVPAKEYWPIHNLLNVIVKMLNSMLA